MLLSCGGSNSTLVYVSPATATISPGATLQFTANVVVTWSASSGGAINSAGFFTAGSTAETVTITATSTDSSRSTGTATVSISTTTTTTTTTSSSASGIAHRVFVSNSYSGSSTSTTSTTGILGGVLNIVNADADVVSTSNFVFVGGSPTFMAQTSDLAYEVVYDSADKLLAVVDNSTETVSAKVLLAGAVTSTGVTLVPGASAAYAAVPTASVAADASGNPIYGAVYEAILSTGSTISTSVPGARYLSMDHNANNLLVFSQNSDAVTLVNNTGGALTSSTGTLTSTLVNGGTTNCTASSFSRPVAAVFSDDDTTAYVLSSGPANGGTQAMVAVLDMTQSPPACVQTLPVSGANVGLLPDTSTGAQGTTLYVAGMITTPCTSDATQTCQQGVLTVIDTSTNTASNPVPFGPTAANLLPGVLTFDGTNLWIGSSGCQVSVNAPGCLSIYFPATQQVLTNPVPCIQNNSSTCEVFNDATDDITTMVWLQPFNGRKVMYVIEGGSLIAYNSNTSSLPTRVNTGTNYFNIVGQAVDAKAVK